jgi:NAD-dependent dihydropyrimidine dehydrogenase PreA subunit
MKSSDIPREKIPWFPAVAADQCNGCGKCIQFCPHDVYAKEDAASGVVVKNPFSCVVGCSNCESLCPEKAIRFPEMETIAALIRELRAERRDKS